MTSEFGQDWSPDGERVACVKSFNPSGALDPGVYVGEVRTGRSKRVMSTAGGLASIPVDVRWNPRGERLLLNYGTRPAILDLQTSALTLVTDGDRWLMDPAWSPEGDSVWYFRSGNNNEPRSNMGLYVTPAAGGIARRFVSVDGHVVWPAGRVSFSPDAGQIVYAEQTPDDPNGHGLTEIFVVARDGSRRHQVTRLGGIAANPQCIRGGREILFDFVGSPCLAVSPSGEYDLLSVDLQSGELRRWPRSLGSARFQFSFPPVVYQGGHRVLVVGPASFAYGGVEAVIGRLYSADLIGSSRVLVFRSASPLPLGGADRMLRQFSMAYCTFVQYHPRRHQRKALRVSEPPCPAPSCTSTSMRSSPPSSSSAIRACGAGRSSWGRA